MSAKLTLTELFHKILGTEFFRFAIVGVIATAIHYGVYYLLLLVFGVNISYTIGYIISWCCNFYLTSRFTFKSKANVKKGIGFALSHAVNYVLHMLFLNLFIHQGASETIAPVFVYCCVVPINFILVRTVFKAKIFQ